MTRSMLLAALIAALCAGQASAQNADPSQPTLGQRLGNFSRAIFGDPDDETPPPDQTPKAAPKPRPKPTTTTARKPSPPAKAQRSATTPAIDPPTPRVAQNTKLFDSEPPAPSEFPPQPVEDLGSPDDGLVQDRLAPADATTMPSSRRRGASPAPEASSRQLTRDPRRSVAAPPFDDDLSAPLTSDDGRPRPSPLREAPAPRVARSERLGSALPPAANSESSAPRGEDDQHVLITRKSPNISIETTGPRRITIGKEAVYTVACSNAGDVAASDVVVYVSLPDWAEVAGAQASSGTTGASQDKAAEGYQWRIASLGPRSRQELSLRVIPRKSQPFDLAVRWTCSPSSSQATVEVEEPKLEMAISGPTDVIYGEHQLYKLTISNPGTGDAEEVMIQLVPINPGEGSVATHRLGKLPAGSSKSVEIELTARQAGNISIKADATADGNLRASAAQEVLVRRAGLQVAVAGPKLHYASSPAAYEIRVKNPGDTAAKNVTLVAALPAEVELLSASGDGQFDAAQARVTWSVGEIPAGGDAAVSFKCTLKSTGVNRIEATATAEGDLKDAGLANTQVMALADLVLEVTDTPGPIPVGQEMEFVVHVRNRGTNSAEQVELVAYFSEGFEPIGVEGGKFELGAGTVLFKPIATLAAGGETSYKIKARASTAGNHRVRVELV
ncbi:MAG TPA: CARDB domain-containing protein, partial [Pirellulales bacterium]|nr:CARDB domain-containing protein [Pirellulales bacterium]